MGYNISLDGESIRFAASARDRIEAKLIPLESRARQGDISAMFEIMTLILAYRNGYSAITDRHAEEFVYLENLREIIEGSAAPLPNALFSMLFEEGSGSDVSLAMRIISVLSGRPLPP